jgi:hypothetical protein
MGNLLGWISSGELNNGEKMHRNLTGRSIKRLFTTGLLTAVVALSGCTQVDQMFDNNGALPTGQVQGGAVHPSPRDAVRAASQRCDGITGEHTWLDCYYGAAQPVRAELGLPPAPVSQQTLVPTQSN